MSLSPRAAVVSFVVRLASQSYSIWRGFVVSCGGLVVLVYVACHGIVSGGYAKLLSVASERGVTAIEYGLIAALIALSIIVAVKLVGTNLTGLFTYIGGKVVAP
jgi:pilus assembly protein Flp/PilA